VFARGFSGPGITCKAALDEKNPAEVWPPGFDDFTL